MNSQPAQLNLKKQNNFIQKEFLLSSLCQQGIVNHNDHDVHIETKVKSEKNLILFKDREKSAIDQLFYSEVQIQNIQNSQILDSQTDSRKVNTIKNLATQLIHQIESYKGANFQSLEILNPLRETLEKLYVQKIKAKNKQSIIQNIKKNNYRDLARIYIHIIDSNLTYRALYFQIRQKMNKDQKQNLEDLRNKMAKFQAKRKDIVLFRRCSPTLKNILEQINQGSELYHQIMLSDKKKQVKIQLLSRLQQMIQQIAYQQKNFIQQKQMGTHFNQIF